MRSTDGHVRDDVELLTKMVSMSQVDINKLRAGDLLNLKEDLCDLVVGHTVTAEHKEKIFKQLTIEDITKIQSLFRKWFEALIEGKQSPSWTVNVPMKFIIEASSHSPSERFEYSVISSDPVGAAAVSLVLLICRSDVAPNRFRRCPECGLLFFLSRKPDERTFYCSTACAGRTATRNYRKAKEGKLKTRTQQSNSGHRTTSQSAGNLQLRIPRRSIIIE